MNHLSEDRKHVEDYVQQVFGKVLTIDNLEVLEIHASAIFTYNKARYYLLLELSW